ncbi:hypothetical protein [Bartonella mastomydis]|uniref:hypothetical protein n=1 Tax=Bartonella mastomydis TaxID=1820002 RepID=UPI001116BF28|nr:hypothetical protein [Bartonella mastomydis]
MFEFTLLTNPPPLIYNPFVHDPLEHQQVYTLSLNTLIKFIAGKIHGRPQSLPFSQQASPKNSRLRRIPSPKHQQSIQRHPL